MNLLHVFKKCWFLLERLSTMLTIKDRPLLFTPQIVLIQFIVLITQCKFYLFNYCFSCVESYLSNEYPRLHPLNQEAAEQFNSVLRMVTHSVAMMSLENYLTAINVFVTFFNLRWIDCLINVWQNFIDFLFTSKPDIQIFRWAVVWTC